MILAVRCSGRRSVSLAQINNQTQSRIILHRCAQNSNAAGFDPHGQVWGRSTVMPRLSPINRQRSSPTKNAPSAISFIASVDLPEPEGPTIKIPTPSTDTQVECLISRSLILTTVNLLQNGRQAAQMSRPFALDGYFQPKSPIMRFENLFGNCQS